MTARRWCDGVTEHKREFLYDASWRIIEERTDPSTSVSSNERVGQIVWGVRGPDDAVLRRWRGAGSSTWPTGGSTGTTTGGRWWYLSDQQGSVVGLIDSSANIVERVRYDAYGNALHHRGCDVDGDRDVDSADASAITTLLATSSGSIPITASTYKAEYDLNRDGAITTADSTLVSSNTGAALTAGLISLGGASTSGGIGGSSGPDNPIGYAGYVFNAETRIYTVRFRHYWAALGTWLTRDPLGYVDGGNLYEYVGGMPLMYTDPFGLILSSIWEWAGDLVDGVETIIDMVTGADGEEARVFLEATGKASAARKRQICEALAAGLISESEAAMLCPEPRATDGDGGANSMAWRSEGGVSVGCSGRRSWKRAIRRSCGS